MVDSSRSTPASASAAQDHAVSVKSRVFIFTFGVLAAILGVVLHTALAAGPLPPTEWTVEINLGEDDVYKLTRRAETHTVVYDASGGTRSTKSSTQADFKIEKFCGSNDWSYLHFLLANLTLSREEQEEQGGIADTPELSVLGAETAEEQASSSFIPFMASLLPGHSFTAKLGHDGSVMQRDESSMTATLERALTTYCKKKVDSLVKANEDSIYEGGRKDLAMIMRDNLLEEAKEMVEELEESAYPYLQASPAHSQPIGVGDSWTRQTNHDLIPLTQKFTLQHFVGEGSRPVVVDAQTVQYADTTTRDSVPAAPLTAEQEKEEQEEEAHLKEEEAAATKENADSNPDLDSSWLVVSVSSTETINVQAGAGVDGGVLGLYIQSILPEHLKSKAVLEHASVDIVLHGRLVVGAQTGVVLDGRLALHTTTELKASYLSPSFHPVSHYSPLMARPFSPLASAGSFSSKRRKLRQVEKKKDLEEHTLELSIASSTTEHLRGHVLQNL